MKPIYRKRKNYYKYQRSERIYPFKKRKHFGYSSPSNSDGGISCEFISDSPLKGNDGNVSGTSSSVAGQHTSFQPRDSYGMRTFDGVIHVYSFHLIGVCHSKRFLHEDVFPFTQ